MGPVARPDASDPVAPGRLPYIPVDMVTLANVTMYQGTTANLFVARNYYVSAIWIPGSTGSGVTDSDRLEHVSVRLEV